MRGFLKIFVFVVFLFPGLAFAGKVFFGVDESIYKIQDVEIVSPNNERLYLGYKTSIRMFIAGVYLRDDGYVISAFDSDERYSPLTDENIEAYQNSGLLPNPLPKYEISIFSYLAGYSLWLIILILVIWGVFDHYLKKFRGAYAQRKTSEGPDERVVTTEKHTDSNARDLEGRSLGVTMKAQGFSRENREGQYVSKYNSSFSISEKTTEDGGVYKYLALAPDFTRPFIQAVEKSHESECNNELREATLNMYFRVQDRLIRSDDGMISMSNSQTLKQLERSDLKDYIKVFRKHIRE